MDDQLDMGMEAMYNLNKNVESEQIESEQTNASIGDVLGEGGETISTIDEQESTSEQGSTSSTNNDTTDVVSNSPIVNDTEDIKPIRKGRGRLPLGPNVLRQTQLRVLAALSDKEATNGTSSLNIDQISAITRVSVPMLKQGLGSNNPEKREAHDRQYGYKSLISHGYVCVVYAGGVYQYYLSPIGQRKCDDLEDELIAIRMKEPRDAGLSIRQGPKKPKDFRRRYTKRLPKRVAKHEIVEVDLSLCVQKKPEFRAPGRNL
jgi:hypothetical protein